MYMLLFGLTLGATCAACTSTIATPCDLGAATATPVGVTACEQLGDDMAVLCAAVCSLGEVHDEGVRARCDCDAPATEEEDKEDDERPLLTETEYNEAVADAEDALRDAICNIALGDVLEWQEDADVVEITDTSLTMAVTEDVVLYTLCHTACSSSCGVEHNVSDVSIYEDKLVVNGAERTPASFFFNGTSALWASNNSVVVNVLGTEDGRRDVSVKMEVWNPSYDEAGNTVRFDARLAESDDMSDESPSPEGDDRRRRRLLDAGDPSYRTVTDARVTSTDRQVGATPRPPSSSSVALSSQQRDWRDGACVGTPFIEEYARQCEEECGWCYLMVSDRFAHPFCSGRGYWCGFRFGVDDRP